VRIGLIGLGRIGAFHAETLAGLGTVELVVTDALPGVAAEVAARTGAATAPTAEALLAGRPDGVVIASPTPTHLPLTEAAVRAGVPAFCEKPVVADPGVAGPLLALVEAGGVPVQVGFPRRFDPAFLRVKADADAGMLGRLTTVRSTTMDPAPPSAAYVRASGGIFRDCAIHDLDAVRWLVGREVVEVYATGTAAGAEHIRAAGDVDTAAAVLTFDGGTLGVISCTRQNGRGHDVRLEVHGERDAVAAGLDDGLPLRAAFPGATFPAGPPHRFFVDRFAAAFRAELVAFTEVVAGAPVRCTLRDGLEASWLAEACARSLAEHRPVRRSELGQL
jgi:myo-inositol 2-dehydrogenase/D-chiro-inositol 1-dehydrogenase